MDSFDINMQQQQQEELERLKREILMKILTKEALERLGRVKVVNPDLAARVELYLVQLYQTGQIKEMISDTKLKEILKILMEKKDFKIKRS